MYMCSTFFYRHIAEVDNYLKFVEVTLKQIESEVDVDVSNSHRLAAKIKTFLCVSGSDQKGNDKVKKGDEQVFVCFFL